RQILLPPRSHLRAAGREQSGVGVVGAGRHAKVNSGNLAWHPRGPVPKRAIVTTVVLAIVAGVLGYLLRSYWSASPLPPGRMLLADNTEIFYAANTRVSQ